VTIRGSTVAGRDLTVQAAEPTQATRMLESSAHKSIILHTATVARREKLVIQQSFCILRPS